MTMSATNIVNTLSTQELTVKVERSLGKTEQIVQPQSSRQILNTEMATLPIKVSAAPKLNKETVLDGGITKSANVIVGEDNIIYANVRVSSEQGNAIAIKDDGLYVSPTEQSAGGGEVDLTGGDTSTDTVTVEKGVIKAETKISAQADNALSVQTDGLFVPTYTPDISAAEVAQMIEDGKSDVVLRNFNGVAFTYSENALVISVGGVNKMKISAQGVDFFV